MNKQQGNTAQQGLVSLTCMYVFIGGLLIYSLFFEMFDFLSVFIWYFSILISTGALFNLM